LTVEAGEWLYNQRQQPSDILRIHADRGEWMIYFSIGLLVVAVTLAVLHWLTSRSDKPRKAAAIIVAVLALAVGISSIVGVYRIGDAGAQSVWGQQS
jgi:heme A synthase